MKILSADLSLPKHSQAVILLLDEYAKGVMGGGSELSGYTRDHLIPELQELKNCHIILAFIDDTPAGLAICFEGFSTFLCKPILNIHDFTVAPFARGQGLSKDLLLKIEELAINLGCCKLTLEVLEGNKLAKHVYENFGFNGYELDPAMGRAMFYEKKLKTA